MCQNTLIRNVSFICRLLFSLSWLHLQGTKMASKVPTHFQPQRRGQLFPSHPSPNLGIVSLWQMRHVVAIHGSLTGIDSKDWREKDQPHPRTFSAKTRRKGQSERQNGHPLTMCTRVYTTSIITGRAVHSRRGGTADMIKMSWLPVPH